MSIMSRTFSPERATQQLGELVLPCRFLRLGPLARGEALGTGRIAHLLPLRLLRAAKAEQLATAHEALDADPGVAQHLLNLPHLADQGRRHPQAVGMIEHWK